MHEKRHVRERAFDDRAALMSLRQWRDENIRFEADPEVLWYTPHERPC